MCDHDWVAIVTAAYRLRKGLLTEWPDRKSWGYRARKKCSIVQWKAEVPHKETQSWKTAENRMVSIKGLKGFLVEEAKHAKNQRT